MEELISDFHSLGVSKEENYEKLVRLRDLAEDSLCRDMTDEDLVVILNELYTFNQIIAERVDFSREYYPEDSEMFKNFVSICERSYEETTKDYPSIRKRILKCINFYNCIIISISI